MRDPVVRTLRCSWAIHRQKPRLAFSVDRLWYIANTVPWSHLGPAREAAGFTKGVCVHKVALKHHRARVAEVADPFRRVAFDENEVGNLAYGD